MKKMLAPLVSAAACIALAACQDDQGLRIEVTDTGSGIAPEDLPRVFDRFYRADSARSTGSGRVGLGLAIVKAIATALGGSVHATNAAGGGACFEVSLPATPRAEPSQESLSLLTSDSYLDHAD